MIKRKKKEYKQRKIKEEGEEGNYISSTRKKQGNCVVMVKMGAKKSDR